MNSFILVLAAVLSNPTITGKVGHTKLHFSNTRAGVTIHDQLRDGSKVYVSMLIIHGTVSMEEQGDVIITNTLPTKFYSRTYIHGSVDDINKTLKTLEYHSFNPYPGSIRFRVRYVEESENLPPIIHIPPDFLKFTP